MQLFSKFLLIGSLVTMCTSATAGPRELGADYRRLESNYAMLTFIQEKCPEFEYPEMVKKPKVEQEMQNKIGIESYIQFMTQMNKSDLRQNAKDTIEKLFANIEGCHDPKLTQAVERIAVVHAQAYERFHAEPALVKPKDVPVPMRR